MEVALFIVTDCISVVQPSGATAADAPMLGEASAARGTGAPVLGLSLSHISPFRGASCLL